jgi:hypothetical protein
LARIALENDILKKINYKDMIEDFISRNTRRMILFHLTSYILSLKKKLEPHFVSRIGPPNSGDGADTVIGASHELQLAT